MVAVCWMDPDVAVTVTVDPPMWAPDPPHEERSVKAARPIGSRKAKRRRHLRAPNIANTRAGINFGAKGSEFPDGVELAVWAVMVSIVVAAVPVGVTVDGLKTQFVPAGNPEQAKLTGPLNPV